MSAPSEIQIQQIQKPEPISSYSECQLSTTLDTNIETFPKPPEKYQKETSRDKHPNDTEKQEWEKMCENLSECSSLDRDEVRCVMQQAECDMLTAVKALQKHGNLVDAILDIAP